MTMRAFDPSTDYEAVSRFLTGLYEPDNRDGAWLQPIWEYAYTHPWFDRGAVDRIGICEERGTIVGVVTYELGLGEAFLNVRRDRADLKPAMLDHAERYLVAMGDDGSRRLHVFVPDFDGDLREIVERRGYQPEPAADRPMSKCVIPTPFPAITLPDGFALRSLADCNDLRKMGRVLHRGFNHPGEPPEGDIEERRRMQLGPRYRADLAVVVVAPSGEFASFCGMWYDAANRFGYVEPVATDPDYRRRGLGSAAVLEGIRRSGALGASVAYVGSTMPFYRALGFRRVYTACCWARSLPHA